MGSPKITIRQLESFCATAETGSLTAAADRLHVSPAGVSQAITQLEEQLGIQLTLRTRGRGVEITAAGHTVAELARAVTEGLHGIQDIADAMRGELTGTLTVGIFTTLSPWLFPRIAEHFNDTHPQVSLELVEGGSAELQAMLLSGNIDAALLYHNHLLPGARSFPVTPVRLQIALAPTHPLARLDTIPLHLLKEEPAALLSLRPATDHVEAILEQAGLTPRVKWRSANVETLRSLVARGLAYTIIMGRPYGDTSYDGLPLVYRAISDPLPDNSVVLAFAHGARPTAKTQALLDFTTSAFRPDAPAKPHTWQHHMGELS
ncbi:LysR family transcriptional regulator [Leucobacter sp. cx-328]|uniref:LysR family transcriptional regulator n=1 Tax=unclassified Leucobacter TaxID=2621730 RepID=UPI00165D3F5D|nr:MULTISPECIES: LysR family transcriptional regulator [unclassified Leucobacter]MBC9944518.1 LysR family transcriptional regulator [Leucobacter sp. cx-328]